MSAKKAARILEYSRLVHGVHRFEGFNRYEALSLRIAIAQGLVAWFKWVAREPDKKT